jgi:hypothetical protein
MDFENTILTIKKLYNLIASKDSDVVCTYKGTSYGVSIPWIIKIDNREAIGKTHIEAASILLEELRKELNNKIAGLELQAKQLRTSLGSFNN